jgi:hypothetical protein
METSAPANFKTNPPLDYNTWEVWNIAANNQYPPPAGSGPDRRDPGNPSAGWSYLGQHFGSTVSAPLTGYALQAASDFMNLCEDLTKLATLADGNASWQTLVADLMSIIKNDVAVDFIPATTLALTESLGQAALLPQVTGPAANEPSISVTVLYS